MMNREFVMIKPNAVRRGLVGNVIREFEKRGIQILALKMIRMTPEQAKELYREHEGKKFYNELIEFAISGPVVVLVFECERAIETVRHIVGATDPLNADLESIRGMYGLTVTKNIIHASDSQASYEREYKIFFNDNEFLDYEIAVKSDL